MSERGVHANTQRMTRTAMAVYGSNPSTGTSTAVEC